MLAKTIYTICESQINPDFEENKECTTYGLECHSKGRLVQTIRDVSPNYKKVKRLAKLFTKLRLSPVHFLDAVEDSLE